MTDSPPLWFRILDWLSIAPMLFVGALQMYHVDAGFITNYGGDITGPAFFYYTARRAGIRSRLTLSAKATAAVIFALCLAWELSQRFDLSGTPLTITAGTFDPIDILAYGGTLAACYTGERWLIARRIVSTNVRR